MIRQLSVILLFLIILTGYQNIFAQDKNQLATKPIKIDVSEATLQQYLDIITAQGLILSYSSNQLKLAAKQKVKKGVYPAIKLLNLLLAADGLATKVETDKIIIYLPKSPKLKTYTLSGFIYTGNGMESLPFASLNLLGTTIKARSNDYGFYTIDLPQGENLLKISYSGYTTLIDTLKITNHKVLNFHLQAGLLLDEVEIRPTNMGKSATELQNVNLKTAANLAMSLGEVDPLKAIQLNAGVSGGLVGGNMYVRGGSPDQNLVLLDGIPVYNYNHFTGLLSIFNNDAVKHIDFYKGGFPPRYEGRLSSVIDVKTKDGNMKEYHGAVNIGLLTSSAMLEGPLLKNKVSFMGSLRRSWIDGLTQLLYKDNGGLKYYLYDANLKINYRVDSTSRVYLSIYKGSDKFKINLFDDDDANAIGLNWSNDLLSFRWNKVHNSRMFHNTTLSYSNFKNQLNITDTDGNPQFNRITDLGIDNELNYNWSNELTTEAGIKAKLTRFRSAPEFEVPTSARDQQSVHLHAYTENDVAISNKLKFIAGLHYTAYLTNHKNYFSFQPRTKFVYNLTEKKQFYGSYALMTQFYHQISVVGITLPNEFRAPSTANIPPQRSIIYEIGYLNQLNNTGRINLQVYRKNFTNLLIYRPQQDVFNEQIAPNWEDRFTNGKGYSQGFEIEYGQSLNWLSINSAYTYFKTMYNFTDLNNGKSFKAPHDLRHQFTTAITAKLNTKWNLFTLFTYSSGMLVTVPNYKVPDLDQVIDGNANNDDTYYYAQEPNNYRLPANYSLNIGANYTTTFKSQHQGKLNFGINNVLNQPMPFQVNTSVEANELHIVQSIPFKLLPYVGYSYSF